MLFTSHGTEAFINASRCTTCGGLLRPAIVWFGETLDDEVLDASFKELDSCDLCLVVGTSSIVYPAAMFAPQVTELVDKADAVHKYSGIRITN